MFNQLLFIISLLALTASTAFSQSYVEEPKKTRIGFSAGYGHLFAKLEDAAADEFSSYNKSLRSGVHFTAFADFHVSGRMGLGAQISSFQSSGEYEGGLTLVDNTGTEISGKIEDDISVSLYAITVSVWPPVDGKKFYVLPRAGVGYLRMVNDGVAIVPAKLTGGTIGFLFDVDANYEIVPNFSVAFTSGVVLGSIEELDFETPTSQGKIKAEDGEWNNLGHFKASLGLRLLF